MRYFNCQKKKIFELFGQGLIPSQIYNRVTVTKHTLFNYYQEWKKERKRLKEEAERIRLITEREANLRREKLQKELKLTKEFNITRKEFFELVRKMGRSERKEEYDALESAFFAAHSKLVDATTRLYPNCTTIESFTRIILNKK